MLRTTVLKLTDRIFRNIPSKGDATKINYIARLPATKLWETTSYVDSLTETEQTELLAEYGQFEAYVLYEKVNGREAYLHMLGSETKNKCLIANFLRYDALLASTEYTNYCKWVNR